MTLVPTPCFSQRFLSSRTTSDTKVLHHHLEYKNPSTPSPVVSTPSPVVSSPSPPVTSPIAMPLPLMQEDLQKIVDELTKKLIDTPEFTNRVQGPPGPPSPPVGSGPGGQQGGAGVVLDTKWSIEE